MNSFGASLRCVGTGLLLTLAAIPATALEWVTTSFHGTVAPMQATLEVAFSFRNNGPRAVKVQSIQTNCDCLSAQTDRAVYQPGEAGLVTARFTVGERFGLYQRAITLVTDDGPPQKLSVAIEVPEPASLEPRELFWALGAAGEERSVEIKVVAPLRIVFSEAYATNETFRVRLEALEAGRHYRLLVTPVDTGAVANAAIRVVGVAETGQEVIVNAYANVR
jgi:hypothetical protein